MITVLQERPERLPLATACNALGLNRSTVYQWSKPVARDVEPKSSRKDTCNHGRCLNPSATKCRKCC